MGKNKTPSMQDIANAAEVSFATVSRVFNEFDKVSEKPARGVKNSKQN